MTHVFVALGSTSSTAAAGDHTHATSRIWMPLTTIVSGVPGLVWDGDDSLISTEAPT